MSFLNLTTRFFFLISFLPYLDPSYSSFFPFLSYFIFLSTLFLFSFLSFPSFEARRGKKQPEERNWMHPKLLLLSKILYEAWLWHVIWWWWWSSPDRSLQATVGWTGGISRSRKSFLALSFGAHIYYSPSVLPVSLWHQLPAAGTGWPAGAAPSSTSPSRTHWSHRAYSAW